jgi:hypothetical protein
MQLTDSLVGLNEGDALQQKIFSAPGTANSDGDVNGDGFYDFLTSAVSAEQSSGC